MSELQPWCKRYGVYHRTDADGLSIGTVEQREGRWYGVAHGGEVANGGNGYGSPEAARVAVDRELADLDFVLLSEQRGSRGRPSTVRLQDLHPRIDALRLSGEPRSETIRRVLLAGLAALEREQP